MFKNLLKKFQEHAAEVKKIIANNAIDLQDSNVYFFLIFFNF